MSDKAAATANELSPNLCLIAMSLPE
jgi:hypothetical protein